MIVDVVVVARGYRVALVLEPHGGSEDRTEIQVRGSRNQGAVAVAVLEVLSTAQDAAGAIVDLGLRGVVSVGRCVPNLGSFVVVHVPATGEVGPSGTVVHVGGEGPCLGGVAPEHVDGGSLTGHYGIAGGTEVAVSVAVDCGDVVGGEGGLVEANVVDYALEAEVVSIARPISDGHLVVMQVQVGFGGIARNDLDAVDVDAPVLARPYGRDVIPRSRGDRAGGALHPVGVAVAALEYVGLASVSIGVPVPPEENGVGVVYVVGENGAVSRIVGAKGVELGPSRNGHTGNLAVGTLETGIGLHAARGIEVDALAELGVDPVGTAAARPSCVVVLAAEIARLGAGTFVQAPVSAEILRTSDAHAAVGFQRTYLWHLHPDAGSAPGVPFVHLVG